MMEGLWLGDMFTKRMILIEGSLEVKVPAIWTDEKQKWEESEKRGEKEDQRRECQKKEDPGARDKVRKSRNTICGSLKRRVRSHRARWEMMQIRLGTSGGPEPATLSRTLLDAWNALLDAVHSAHGWPLKAWIGPFRCPIWSWLMADDGSFLFQTTRWKILGFEINRKCKMNRKLDIYIYIHIYIYHIYIYI